MSTKHLDSLAFPIATASDVHQTGMTLRDYFAAAALPAIIEATAPHSLHLPREAADLAYAQADAMLTERAK